MISSIHTFQFIPTTCELATHSTYKHTIDNLIERITLALNFDRLVSFRQPGRPILPSWRALQSFQESSNTHKTKAQVHQPDSQQILSSTWNFSVTTGECVWVTLSIQTQQLLLVLSMIAMIAFLQRLNIKIRH